MNSSDFSGINWSGFRFQTVKLPSLISESTVEMKGLENTSLLCSNSTEAGQWRVRKTFIEHVVQDVLLRCPKEEKLAFVSLGSGELLMEYIIGKALIENGFHDIVFLLVDPSYSFLLGKLSAIMGSLKDFRAHIQSVYQNKYNKHFPEQGIKYLSRGQNIAKYFPSQANVVVVESLPPYAENIKDMKKHKVTVKTAEQIFTGNHRVPEKFANSIAFFPKQYASQISSKAKLDFIIPLAIFKSSISNYYLDWGCKIHSDGRYYVDFSHWESYLSSLEISNDRKIELKTGETVAAKDWIPKMKEAVEKSVQEDFEKWKIKNLQNSLLSQDDISAMLQKVKQVAIRYMPGIASYFLADYFIDRKEAISYISSNASHHYRNIFTLAADPETSYKITVEQIA